MERNDEQIIKLLADIENIIAVGAAYEAPGRQPGDKERRGLLKLAGILAKVDFSSRGRKPFKEFVRELQKKQELADSELDLVAGGIDLNWLLDNEPEKK